MGDSTPLCLEIFFRSGTKTTKVILNYLLLPAVMLTEMQEDQGVQLTQRKGCYGYTNKKRKFVPVGEFRGDGVTLSEIFA